jgi:hypothetical protein
MGELKTQLTASQVILLAAGDLDAEGTPEFSEWNLTVATWRRDPNRFGLRGYERDHPDHKRVMNGIMAPSNRNNPIRMKFLEKTRPNFYRLTALGKAEVSLLQRRSSQGPSTAASPASVYSAVEGFVSNGAFKQWQSDSAEPRTWLGALSFLGLRRQDAVELNDRIRAALRAVEQAEEWCGTNARDFLTSGPTGGRGGPIHLADLKKVRTFIRVLEERFADQMAAIRARK